MAAPICNLNFLDGFVFQSECINVYIAKLLGYAILAGSVALKLPQILNIIFTKDVEGLSEIAFYTEVPMGITTVMYNYRQGNPFSSYGETVAILIQNIILVFLLWAYMKRQATPMLKFTIFAGCLSVAYACHSMRPSILYLLPLSNLPMMIWSRSAQIISNFKRGSTGQLSLITNFLMFGGTLARVFTTIQEVGWDLSLLSGLGISAVLSGILMTQIIVYSYIKKPSQKTTTSPVDKKAVAATTTTPAKDEAKKTTKTAPAAVEESTTKKNKSAKKKD